MEEGEDEEGDMGQGAKITSSRSESPIGLITAVPDKSSLAISNLFDIVKGGVPLCGSVCKGTKSSAWTPGCCSRMACSRSLRIVLMT